MRHWSVATMCLVIAAVVVSCFQFAAAATVDPITEWSIAAQSAATASAMPPFRTPITLAILHLAMYDAVTAIAGEGQPYAVPVPVIGPASADSAAVEAGYRVLLAEFPSQQKTLDLVYQQLRAAIPESEQKTNGAAVGAAAAGNSSP